MSVTIGDITFDRVRYDADVDMLYLHAGEPSDAVDFDGTPDGHHTRYDRDGRLVGITLLHPKLLLAEDGRVVIPTDQGVLEAGPETLEPALAAAAR